jgi:hypothetical protein
MNPLVRVAVLEVQENGFICDDTRNRMTVDEVALALNLAGA